jgi:hypothetical protein
MVEIAIRASLRSGRMRIHAVAREHGADSGTIQRVRKELTGNGFN